MPLSMVGIALIVASCATLPLSSEQTLRVYVVPEPEWPVQVQPWAAAVERLERDRRLVRVGSFEAHAVAPIDYVIIPPLPDDPGPLPEGTVPPSDVKRHMDWLVAHRRAREARTWAAEHDVDVVTLEEFLKLHDPEEREPGSRR